MRTDDGVKALLTMDQSCSRSKKRKKKKKKVKTFFINALMVKKREKNQ
jgi:hypothetical protein